MLSSHGFFRRPGTDEEAVEKIVEDMESTPSPEKKSKTIQRVGPQNLKQLHSSNMLNHAIISALFRRLVSGRCMIFDSLELDGGSKQLPSEKRQQEGHSVARIIILNQLEPNQSWLSFVYSLLPWHVTSSELLSKLLSPYTIRRYEEEVKADDFEYGSNKNVIIALPNEVNMVAKRSFKKPTRESIIATPRASGRVRRMRKYEVTADLVKQPCTKQTSNVHGKINVHAQCTPYLIGCEGSHDL
ncbi:MAG: hypothetical protein LQ350_007870 [Teloschistes chrysophthalmus]|nr:MAG: hypothetical protein LQ350_007870 [Niorma chrysophthalma]